MELKIGSIEDIGNYLAAYWSIDLETVRKLSRRSQDIKIRHFICSFLHSLNMFPLTQIAYITGNTNHSTVINSVRKVNNICEYDKIYRSQYNRFVEYAKLYNVSRLKNLELLPEKY